MESQELKLVCPGGQLYLNIHPKSAMDRKDVDSARCGTDAEWSVGRQGEGVGTPWASAEKNLAGTQPT